MKNACFVRTFLRVLTVLFAVMTVGEARAQYVSRNNNEFYWPYLINDNLGFLSPGYTRTMQDEYTRRFLMNTYGESRINRPYFVDVGLEGIYPIGMPGIPYLGAGRAQEATLLDPKDLAVRAEVYGSGYVSKNWELAADIGTRAHLRVTEIPAEFFSRVMMIHHGFAGINPLKSGFFVGPEIRPMDAPIGGLSLGGFALLSQSRQSFTQARAQITWWGDTDPFQNLLQFELGQNLSVWNRRALFRLSAEAEIRQVRDDQYRALFGVEAERNAYIDLALEGSGLFVLPAKFRFDVAGRFVPFHTPDERVVRWYRPVYPQVSATLLRKLAIFDLALSYSFAWVPPLYKPTESYEDSGSGIIPNSAPGHLFSLNINIRI